MPRRYSFPEGHWNWPLKLSHYHSVRDGPLIFTGGQVDLDTTGTVRNPGDIDAQCKDSMAYLLDLLNDLDAGYSDLVRLVVYYVGDFEDKKRLLSLMAEIIGAQIRPVVNLVNLPELCYPDMLIEIEGVAIASGDHGEVVRKNYFLDDMPYLPEGFSHVVRVGDIIFTSDMSSRSADGSVLNPDDIVNQTQLMMARLQRALSTAGATMSDVVKVNTFYCGNGTAEDWAISAGTRASYFDDPGPAVTGIPVPSFPHAGLMTQISATAIASLGDNKPPIKRKFVWPNGHWDWTEPLPYKHGNRCGNIIHIGGQVALDANAQVLEPGDMVAQTHIAMENLSRVLAEFDASLDDVVKVTTFYQGSASADELHQNLLIRSNSYQTPGPATTGIPVPSLVYENMVIEIEAIAIVQDYPSGKPTDFE